MSKEPVFVWQDPTRYATRLAHDPRFLAERTRQAATEGKPGAQLGWAHMLLEGRGVERDLNAAFLWFQLGARSGHSDAINMLGRCHELGWGTPLNTRTAAQCFRIAAGMGHTWAQFNLASLMLQDDRLGDNTEMLTLLARSARGGNPKAMNFIGQACEEGWRGRPKAAAARRWYFRAARGGCFRGCFNAARYVMADGDVQGAVAWLRRSVAAAPASFCVELGHYLAAHPDARLREVSVTAYEQARVAPERPPSQQPTLKTATPAQEPPLTSLARGRRSMRRMLGALTRGASSTDRI